MLMILRNQARCPDCDDFIMSTYRHDYKRCKCGRVMVDGGVDYLRGAGGVENNLSITVPDEVTTEEAKTLLGALCVLQLRHLMDADEVLQALVVQARDKPWFPAPAVTSDVVRVLGRLVSFELAVAGPTLPSGLTTTWRRVVRLAPWPVG